MAKKVCFLVDSIFSIGGVQRVTAVIAKALSNTYEVTIVTLDAPSAYDTTLYGLNEGQINFRFFQYPPVGKWKNLMCKAYSYLYRKVLPQTHFTSDLYAHSSFPSELRNALIAELDRQYDVIIGDHAPLAVRLATCKKQLKGSKLMGWIHNSYDALYGKGSLYIGEELQRHYEYQLSKLQHTIVLCHCDAIKYHIPTNVIYNPLTLKPGQPSDGTSKRFLAIGRFSPLHKGFDILIDAFCLFAQHNSEWHLDIVGEGQEGDRIQRMIDKYKLNDRITIHPFTNNIQAYYSRAQVYILSSRWEGMPLVLMEAMSHGLPVVSSDLPVCQEIMGDFGMYFRNGDVEDLSRRMGVATMINWKEKSAEAMDIAKNFSTDSIIKQWKALIEE